jgi:hypothetical protein
VLKRLRDRVSQNTRANWPRMLEAVLLPLAFWLFGPVGAFVGLAVVGAVEYRRWRARQVESPY